MIFRRGKSAGEGGGAAPSPEPTPAFRRGLAGLLLGSLFLAGCAALLFGERGVLDVRRSRRQLADLRAEVAAETERVERLTREVERLGKDPKALERVAREELGMAKPGEVVILLPRDPSWGKPPSTP